jgi:hypothetical protein
MAPSTQSFANHAQYTPGYHFFASPLGLIFLAWTIKRTIDNPNADTAYMLVGALALVGAIAMLRLSALRVQDRVIRLEERLRLGRLLPTDLQPRIEEIRPSHLIALRFASDCRSDGSGAQSTGRPVDQTQGDQAADQELEGRLLPRLSASDRSTATPMPPLDVLRRVSNRSEVCAAKRLSGTSMPNCHPGPPARTTSPSRA